MRKRLKNIYDRLETLYFVFPVQLLVLHLKRNQYLLLIWVLLFAIIFRSAGTVMGIPLLFLDPEYLDQVSFRSLFIVGLSVGIFIMSFQIGSYVLYSRRFNFIGTITSPFLKFCVNNSIIPTIFTICYLYQLLAFQAEVALAPVGEILLLLSGFLLGIFTMVLLIFFYFRFTNRDIFRYVVKKVDTELKKRKITRVNVLSQVEKARSPLNHNTTYYCSTPWSICKVENADAYDRDAVMKVFDQNHLNAILFELALLTVIVLLGIFSRSVLLQVPAAASVLLFFSFLLLLVSALSYWMRTWAFVGIVVLALVANFFIGQGILIKPYHVVGLNYEKPPVRYDRESLADYRHSGLYAKDSLTTIAILERWKAKFPIGTRPKMVVVCSSGGGQRSAVWTLTALQALDSATDGNFLDHATLLTGASGGLIGAAYFRELFLDRKRGRLKGNIWDDRYFTRLAKDNLNPIVFTMFMNDLFFRPAILRSGDQYYKTDRGYAFERKLNQNTENVLNKPIAAYRESEGKGEIPMLIMSPVILNDGRKLLISAQQMSYLTLPSSLPEAAQLKTKGVEFNRLFKDHGAENLNFLTALRMSATFPYISPNVSLPTEPVTKVMDAGIADNFGITDASAFLFVFRDWIKANTDGVVMVVIRDSEKKPEIPPLEDASIVDKLVNPALGAISNWDVLQDNKNDILIEYLQAMLDGKLDLIYLQYAVRWSRDRTQVKLNPIVSDSSHIKKQEELSERASLSWHLTEKEKIGIRKAMRSKENLKEVERVRKMLLPEN